MTRLLSALLVSPHLSVLAQMELPQGVGEVVKIIQIIAFLISVGLIVISGILFATGSVQAAIMGTISAGVIALAVAIVSFAYKVTGNADVVPLSL